VANGFDTSDESYVDDDPVAGFDFDEATQSFDVASSDQGYGSQNIDTGGQQTEGTVLSQAGFNKAMGITATNPFPDSIFSRIFGAENVDYSGMGIDLGGIADLAYDRYLNPLVSRKDGTFSLRSGLSAGEKTRLGEIIEVDRPMSGIEQLARTAISPIVGNPLGLFISNLGTTEKAIAPNKMLPGGLNYDPRLDPSSPQYVGPQSFLGKTLSGLEGIVTGGARPVSRFFEDGKEKPTAIDQLQSQRSFFDPSKKEFLGDRDYRDFVTNMPSATGRGSQGIVRTNVAPFDGNEQSEINRVMNEKVVSTDTSTPTPREKVVGTPINLAGMLGNQKFDLSNQAGRDEYFNFIRRLNPNTFA
tara:strand:- start:51 stop:1124 length:1074 start_codon:yes stop_codon:yes gene_type:complete